MAQEEEVQRRTSCLKTGAKQRSETHQRRGRGRGGREERSPRGEKSFGAGRGSELDQARKDTGRKAHAGKPSLSGERRSEGVRVQSGKEEEEEEAEREPDGRSSLRGSADTRAERRSMRAS